MKVIILPDKPLREFIESAQELLAQKILEAAEQTGSICIAVGMGVSSINLTVQKNKKGEDSFHVFCTTGITANGFENLPAIMVQNLVKGLSGELSLSAEQLAESGNFELYCSENIPEHSFPDLPF